MNDDEILYSTLRGWHLNKVELTRARVLLKILEIEINSRVK